MIAVAKKGIEHQINLKVRLQHEGSVGTQHEFTMSQVNDSHYPKVIANPNPVSKTPTMPMPFRSWLVNATKLKPVAGAANAAR